MPALNMSYADDLNELEAATLEFLAARARGGSCPSREEISRAVGLGGRGYRVSRLLDGLEDKGYIRLGRGQSRAISVVRRPDGRPFSIGSVWVPVLGQIVASAPLPSFGQQDNPFAGEALELTRGLVGGSDDVYALRVSGDSMIDALVRDGDFVILNATQEIRNGDMVAARVTGDDGQEATTLKHYYREGGQVRLQPANHTMLPLFYHPSRVQLCGRVVAVVRQLA
jgi:repressor LexA